jgi:hypothetical protein
MGGFKRFCMFVFGLAGLLGVIALALTWVGPWTAQASALMSIENYFYAVEVCVAIALVIMLVVLLRAIFARSVRTIEVTTVNGGTISVSRDAIASQATHIVEADGTCSADRVDVKAKKSGHVRVHVRVLPHETVDVVAKGAELHDELVRGLASVCGDKVDRVSLEFIEPESVTVAAPASATESEPLPTASVPSYEAPAVEETEPTEHLDSTSEITVSMGGSRAASDTDRQEA